MYPKRADFMTVVGELSHDVTVQNALVGGHEIKGVGGTQTNLVAPHTAIMQATHFPRLVDSLIQALRLRERGLAQVNVNMRVRNHPVPTQGIQRTPCKPAIMFER